MVNSKLNSMSGDLVKRKLRCWTMLLIRVSLPCIRLPSTTEISSSSSSNNSLSIHCFVSSLLTSNSFSKEVWGVSSLWLTAKRFLSYSFHSKLLEPCLNSQFQRWIALRFKEVSQSSINNNNKLMELMLKSKNRQQKIRIDDDDEWL
jgi:hypothetical protein